MPEKKEQAKAVHTKTAKGRESRGLIKVVSDSLGILGESLSRGKIAALLIFSVIGSLLPAAVVYINKLIIDAASRFFSNDLSIASAFAVIVVYACSGLLLAGTGYVRDRMAAAYFSHTADWIQENIMRKSSRIRMAYYDDISYRNKVSFSSTDLPGRIRDIILTAVLLLQDVLTVISLVLVVLAINGWIAVLAAVGFLPLMRVILMQSRANFKFLQDNFAKDNQRYYLHTTTYRRNHLNTLRYYGLRNFIGDKWDGISKELRLKNSRLVIRFFWLRLAANAFLYLCIGGGLVLVIDGILHGRDSIGSIALVLSAVTSLTGSITSLFERIGIIEENGQYVESYQELLSFEDEEPGKIPVSNDLDITFDHVCFTYPHSEREVLHDISIRIRQGEKIAIVGENGSGKSTFVSLLSGFYPIGSGKITVNGVQIEECLEDLRAKTSCLYQSSESYIMTVRENIEIGDISRPISNDELESLGQQTGAGDFVNRLDKGYDTLIGNLSTNNTFDLSGGQRQKLFLTRALARKSARLLILDEPTSALDPMAEADLYKNFAQMAGDRTCVLISHRLGATKLADRILVFRDGRIIEEGTHESLLEQGGYYKKMYAAQAQWYQ